MNSTGSCFRRLLGCALALAIWSSALSAQSSGSGSGSAPTDTFKGNRDGSISSGDSSGGGELPKPAGPGGFTTPKPTKPSKPTSASPPAPTGLWTGWGGPSLPGGGTSGGGGGTGAGGGGGGGSTPEDAEDTSGAEVGQIMTAVQLLDVRGRPLAGVALGVLDVRGELVAHALTDARGVARLLTPVVNGLSLVAERFAIDLPLLPGRAHLLLLVR